MKLKNFTPFVPFAFASRDEKLNDFGVLALQGSFDMVNDEPLKPQQNQADMVFDDLYTGEAGKSSLLQENNIAPYKPNTDFHLKATAYAPGDEPKDKWLVSAQLGKIKKRLLITGPRCWERGLSLSHQLDDPEPILKLPIRYEYAFGGFVVKDKKPARVYSPNPVGCGYEPHSRQNANVAPQIMNPEEFTMIYGHDYIPQGFGPIAPNWSPRIERAGTYNMVWEKTRWPDLPEDFSFDFYNSAHPDLVYPGHVQGDESIVLQNLTPDGVFRSSLPGYELAILVRYEDGELRPLSMMLDTVFLDVENYQAQLTWRGMYSLEKDIRVLEARIRLPDTSLDLDDLESLPLE